MTIALLCMVFPNSDIMAAAKKVIRIRHVGLEKVKLIRTAEKEIALLEA